MTIMGALGPPRATVRRSLRGLLIGAVAIVFVFGALVAWNLFFRPGLAGALAMAMIAMVSIPAAFVFLTVPHTITTHDEGILIKALWRQPVAITWDRIESARIWRAPLGRHPTIVTVIVRGQKSLTASEAEYAGLGALIDAVVAHASDRAQDER
jgi:hypothetical protein